jgi:hypothetical protein
MKCPIDSSGKISENWRAARNASYVLLEKYFKSESKLKIRIFME